MRKTPLLICSIRTEIPYPWVGSSASVFRMSISRVPWTRSLGFSGIKSLYPLASRRSIPFSFRLSRGELPRIHLVGTRAESKRRGQKRNREATIETWAYRVLGYCGLSRPFASWFDCVYFPGWMAVVLALVFAFRQLPSYECGYVCRIDLVPRRRAGQVRVFLK